MAGRPSTYATPAALKAALQAEARRLGFAAVGVATAEPLFDLAALLRLRQERAMATPWEDPDPARRSDPASLLPGARSVVAVAMAYDPPRAAAQAGERAVPGDGDANGWRGPDPSRPNPDRSRRRPEPPGEVALRGYVAAAGRTRSYQHVMRQRLEALGRWLEAAVPGCRWAVQVDTGPLVDRAWAERAGIGWIGKNACVIVPGRGSWVFLGELVTDVALPPDQPLADACGDCDLCLRACPTGAFLGPRQLDPRRCVSFLSQKPGILDPDERAALGQSLYGCDACQVVCPYNRGAGPGHPALRPAALGTGPADEPAPAGEGNAGTAGSEAAGAGPDATGDSPVAPDLVALLRMGRADFRRRYRSLTGAWRGRKTWQRNAVVALGNRGAAARAAVPVLAELLRADPRPDMRALAAWALGRIGGGAARQVLAGVLEREADDRVRAAVREALARMGGDPGDPAGHAVRPAP